MYILVSEYILTVLWIWGKVQAKLNSFMPVILYTGVFKTLVRHSKQLHSADTPRAFPHFLLFPPLCGRIQWSLTRGSPNSNFLVKYSVKTKMQYRSVTHPLGSRHINLYLNWFLILSVKLTNLLCWFPEWYAYGFVNKDKGKGLHF